MAITIEENPTRSSYRWVRSTDGKVAGVCAGLGRALAVDPLILRVIWLVAVLCYGTGVLLYLLCMLCLPREDKVVDAEQKKLLGVCLRLSHKYGMEVGLVRLFAVGALICSAGLAFVAYIILAIALPKPPTNP